ncbi:MAG: hypothetical protein ACRDWD_17720 [Acidimicrobiia bacterium]
MPSMPVYFVGKGTQFGVLDTTYTGEDIEVYRAAIADLEAVDENSMADLARDRHADGLSDFDVEHFRKDWLRDWWRTKHVGELIRQGFLAALRIAIEDEAHPLPLEAVWVCANEDAFQVYVIRGPRQVTVLVFTPPPPSQAEHVAAEFLTEHENIWVVKTLDEDDQRIAPEEIEVLNEGADPVIIQRRLKFAPTGEGTPLS